MMFTKISVLKKILKHKAIIAIIALGLFVRVYQVWLTPPSLNWDEVSHGYNAYSILKTGKDEWGVSLPAIFRAYGDYKLPVYIYLTALSEAVFGVNAFAVRLPSVLAGTFSILFTYLLAKKLYKKESIAVVSALLLALEPWGLFLSRTAVEANVALAFILGGVIFTLHGLERKNNTLSLGVLLFGLSVWTYNSARVFTPILLLGIIIIYRHQFLKVVENRKLFVSGILLLTFFFAPMLFQLTGEAGQARYSNLRIIDDGAVGRIVELRNDSELGALASRLLYNKATYFGFEFLKNYIGHFSPSFLFTKGGSDYLFSTPGYGLLFIANAPFLILGMWLLLSKHRKTPEGRLFIFWLLIAPIASSLTRGSPHVLRSIVLLPLPMILSGIGLVYFFERFTKVKWLLGVYILFAAINFGDFYRNYKTEYRSNYSWSWQYGYKEVIQEIKPLYDDYEKIVFTKKYGEPHGFLLFYWPWEPGEYQASDKIRYFQSNWYWVDNFDKFYFVNDWDIPSVGFRFKLESGKEFDCASCLLITSPGNAPENWEKTSTIHFLDGRPAFEIYKH